jgi:hypothetical protein
MSEVHRIISLGSCSLTKPLIRPTKIYRYPALPKPFYPTRALTSLFTRGGGRISLVASMARPVQVSEKFFYSVGELRIDLVPEDNIAK